MMNFEYALIVETDQYTGNFERELCAYATAAYGECGVGKELSDLAAQEFVKLGFDEYCASSYTWSLSDDDGCHRPVRIWNAPGNSDYNDLIIFLEQPFSSAIFELVKSRIEDFAAKSRENVGKPTDYGEGYRTQCRGGDLHIKKVYMIKRTITIVDDPQEPLNDWDD